MSWLDQFFQSYNAIQAAGAALVQRQTLNFGTGFTVADDPTNLRTTVTATGSGGGTTNANIVTTMSAVTPTLSAQTAFVDGYSAHNDTGASGHGSFAWNPTYTGPADALNIYPTGFVTGAWQRQIGPDFLVNVTWFGAKGDGVTDDHDAIQACINTCQRQGWGMYCPSLTGASGKTTYLTSKPLFLGGTGSAQSAFEIRMGQGAQISVVNSVIIPALVSGLQLPNPVYGTENSLTYVELVPDVFGGAGYNLSMIPNASSVNNWGDGSVTTLGQSFTQPALLGTVTNVLVGSTANYSSAFTGSVYIHGGGFYFLTVVDATHVTLQLFGQVLSTDAATGGTVANGAGVSINGFVSPGVQSSGGTSAGFTFECFVDPIANLPAGTANVYLISSQGKLGTKYPLTNAFYVALYNDQGTAQTRLKFSLTTTSGTTVINSSTSTITAGSLVHVAATYDGVSTMSLYIAGVRVATTSTTGPIVQNWYEQVVIGGLQVDSYPNYLLGSVLPQTIKIAGIGMHAIAKYSGTSFTPPTTVPTYLTHMASVILDFAQQPTLTGPGNVNYGQGWIIATVPNLQGAYESGVPAWLPSKASLVAANVNYVQGPRMTNCTVNSQYGICLFANAALNGVLENCIFQSGIACVTLAGFSYVWRIQNCQMNSGFLTYGFSWCLGVLDGSQYCVVEGGAYGGGLWNIVTDVYAGIMLKDIQFEVTVTGGVLLGSQAEASAPSASVRDCFFQSDQGTNPLAVPVTNSIYAFNTDGVVIEGGYAAGSLTAPLLVIDSCGSVKVDGMWLAVGSATHILELYNQVIPVEVKSQQATRNYLLNTGGTTTSVTHGLSTAISSTLDYQYNVGVGQYLQFTSQPNTSYRITARAVGGSTVTWTLHTPYTGVTAGATQAQVVNTSWLPESGSGQGPLLIGAQESFGSNTVNMIAAAGMTMLVNDFLFGNITFTDANTLLTGGVTITTPNIVGYQRTFINQTGQTLTISAGSGTTVSVTAGSVIRAALLSTGWLLY